MLNDIGTPNPAEVKKKLASDETTGFTADASVAISGFRHLFDTVGGSMTPEYKDRLGRIMAMNLDVDPEQARIEELNDEFGILDQEQLTEIAKSYVGAELEEKKPDREYLVTSVSVAATKIGRDHWGAEKSLEIGLGIVRVLFGPMIATDQKHVNEGNFQQTRSIMWPVVRKSIPSKYSPYAADPSANKNSK